MSIKKVLVTGGAGFIASHLIDRLVSEQYEVVVVDDLSTGSRKNINQKAKFYKADIQDKKMSRIFLREKPDVVFHYAAQISVKSSVKDPVADAKTNILGALNVLENCKLHQVKKIIFSSTGGAMYGDSDIIPTPESQAVSPMSPYGIAKLAAEKYLDYYHKVFGISFVVLRFSNVYGPRQNSTGEAGVVAIFCNKIFSGKEPVIYGDGSQTRDFVYVTDVVDASMSAMETEKSGVFNIATGKETSIGDLFLMIKKESGFEKGAKFESLPPGEQKRSCLDVSLAQKELHWAPGHGVAEGIKETVAWFKNNI